jgi:hypothetical protein
MTFNFILVFYIISYVKSKCGMNTSFTHGKVQKRSVFYNDENFSLTKREFYIDIPEDYNINKKYPVLFYLHWHYGSGYI